MLCRVCDGASLVCMFACVCVCVCVPVRSCVCKRDVLCSVRHVMYRGVGRDS